MRHTVSKPMPTIGARCHGLRVREDGKQWSLIYLTDQNAIVVVDLFRKTTQKTPNRLIERCRGRLRQYDDDAG